MKVETGGRIASKNPFVSAVPDFILWELDFCDIVIVAIFIAHDWVRTRSVVPSLYVSR